MDPAHALRAYLRRHLPVLGLGGALGRSRLFTLLTAAAPGPGELLTIGHVSDLALGAHEAAGLVEVHRHLFADRRRSAAMLADLAV